MNKGYLLDTSVVSVLAPGRETFVPAALREWLQAHHQALFLPSIAIAEMAQGIGKLRRAGSAERADRLDAAFAYKKGAVLNEFSAWGIPRKRRDV